MTKNIIKKIKVAEYVDWSDERNGFLHGIFITKKRTNASYDITDSSGNAYTRERTIYSAILLNSKNEDDAEDEFDKIKESNTEFENWYVAKLGSDWQDTSSGKFIAISDLAD